MEPNLHIPDMSRAGNLTVDDIWRFMCNVLPEAKLLNLDETDKNRLLNFKYGFGNILNKKEEAYVRHCYCEPLLRAVQAVAERPANPTVLDVGCGLGTQSILFGLMPSTVRAVDYDLEQLSVAEKRYGYYKNTLNLDLEVSFGQIDVNVCKFEDEGQFDVIYSHGCIGRMLSAEQIFSRLKPALKPGGLVIMKNSNPGYFGLKLVGSSGPNDISKSSEYKVAAKNNGYRKIYHGGTTMVPRQIWSLGPWVRHADWLTGNSAGAQIHLEMIYQNEET